MRRPRRVVIRRPTGPAARIKNPLAQTRLENDLGPRVIERGPAGRLSPEELARRQRIIKEKEARFLARKLTLKERNLNAALKFPPPVFYPGEGKTCAIVGNASSILDRNDGAIIDTYDVVVRINTPKITCAECQGKRTDFLFVHGQALISLPRLQFPPYKVVVASQHLTDTVKRWETELQRAVGHPKARPTTGFLAAVHMRELGFDVVLYGFDWFSTPSIDVHNVHRGKYTPWKHHYPEWERATLESMLNESVRNNTEE